MNYVDFEHCEQANMHTHVVIPRIRVGRFLRDAFNLVFILVCLLLTRTKASYKVFAEIQLNRNII